MKIVALTGGIGTGKSTVAREFQKQGAAVIDADEISRKIFDLHPELLPPLTARFGTDILDPKSQKLDRTRLADLVFSSPKKRLELENLTHPMIRMEIVKRIEKAEAQKAPLVIVDAALMIETGYYLSFEGLIVVKATQAQQIERIQERDNLTPEEIRKRLAAQLPTEEKIKVADWVIDNSGDLSETQKQVEALYQNLTTENKD